MTIFVKLNNSLIGSYILLIQKYAFLIWRNLCKKKYNLKKLCLKPFSFWEHNLWFKILKITLLVLTVFEIIKYAIIVGKFYNHTLQSEYENWNSITTQYSCVVKYILSHKIIAHARDESINFHVSGTNGDGVVNDKISTCIHRDPYYRHVVVKNYHIRETSCVSFTNPHETHTKQHQ